MNGIKFPWARENSKRQGLSMLFCKKKSIAYLMQCSAWHVVLSYLQLIIGTAETWCVLFFPAAVLSC